MEHEIETGKMEWFIGIRLGSNNWGFSSKVRYTEDNVKRFGVNVGVTLFMGMTIHTLIHPFNPIRAGAAVVKTKTACRKQKV